MRLNGKVAIVTGAGAGIGEAIALRFAAEGARQILNDIDARNGGATLAKVRECGGDAELVTGDISKEETGRRLAERAMAAFGAIHIVVNNAADFTQLGVEEAEVAHWEKVLGVNVVGTALVSKFAIPHMKAAGGSIVNIASMSGVIAQYHYATYNASKGAVLTLTKCMAMDLAQWNIRVNAICPGCIATSASFREAERMGIAFEQWRGQMAPLHLLNRVGEPREVADPAVFLASDEASFITGAHLMVDGGYTAR